MVLLNIKWNGGLLKENGNLLERTDIIWWIEKALEWSMEWYIPITFREVSLKQH